MTALLAFDAANPAIPISAMVRNGAIVAPVYIRGNPGGFQPSDAARVTALRKAGLAPWPNWEAQADFFAHASTDSAKWAGKDAREACLRLGFPDDGTISVPFSFDYQVIPSDYPAALASLKACQDGLGDGYIATSYGQSGLIRYLAGHGFGQTGHWLMASTWGLADYDIGSEHVAIVQSHHADGSWFDSPIPGTDANTVTRPDRLAAWWPDGSPYGDNMPSVDDIFKYVVITEDGNEITFKELLRGLRARSLALTPQTITAAVVAKLPDDAGGGLTRAQVATALESELVSFFGKAVNS